MDEFRLERTAQGDRLTVPFCGPNILRYPLYNKGTGFTADERRRLGIEGALPAQHNTIDVQVRRIYRSIFFNQDPVGRAIGLASLQDRNETLYYRLLHEHLEEAMPIVYTPTVGKASQYYSRVFRRSRGIFITPYHRGRIEQVLRSSAPFAGVKLMVVTDNEAILGIGDQGAGGMAISIGKLALYCVGAGIHPARTLPISLDVGTDNQELLDDPLYLGWRQPRLRGAEYVALVDEFVAAAQAVFPGVVIQWEDFKKDNALMILDRYRHRLPSFNDDIQGTGAVASACVRAGCRISMQAFADSRIVIYGAGAAGLGIQRQLRAQLTRVGVTGDALTRAILVMDSQGIVTEDRAGLDDFKRQMAWPAAMTAELGLNAGGRKDLQSAVTAFKATALVGTSGQGGSFTEATVRAMLANTARPIILPMSNPTSISEAVPEDLLRWTNGKALVATGSPFAPVSTEQGERRIGQANNVFVFPGIGLGSIVSGASEITSSMIAAAANALAVSLTDEELAAQLLVPNIGRLWQVCGEVALAVAQQAISDGVAANTDRELMPARLQEYRWRPQYPEIVIAGESS
ncbi:MAG: NAD-dependent malic enzyme [Gammaproteobacteria bacterium]|nr:NAD-dependent malic enzyme [Gammaproteobacteria bacterium]MDH5303122.1 NAD-dependent malic enzyme [Gammaproteobacteria bacterium]MDH5322156.1 NAD-dependent malic enzyme [Gammaproteobacteria bacterium]